MSEIVKAHKGAPRYGLGEPSWEKRERTDNGPYEYPFRQCSYCGSIHPEDLLNVLKTSNARLERADMKYGYPHKFYCDGVPNPIAGQTVEVGGTYSKGTYTPMMGAAPLHTPTKFYSEHLLDFQGTPLFAELHPYLRSHAGVDFSWDAEKGLMWRIVGPAYAPAPSTGEPT